MLKFFGNVFWGLRCGRESETAGRAGQRSVGGRSKVSPKAVEDGQRASEMVLGKIIKFPKSYQQVETGSTKGKNGNLYVQTRDA